MQRMGPRYFRIFTECGYGAAQELGTVFFLGKFFMAHAFEDTAQEFADNWRWQ